MAYLVHETYQPENKRKDHTVGYTRLPQYDNSKFAVYMNDKSQELVVCVRGTKLNMSDAVADEDPTGWGTRKPTTRCHARPTRKRFSRYEIQRRRAQPRDLLRV